MDAQAERVRNERIEMEEEKKKDAVPPPQEKPDHIREADHIRGNFFMKHIREFCYYKPFCFNINISGYNKCGKY